MGELSWVSILKGATKETAETFTAGVMSKAEQQKIRCDGTIVEVAGLHPSG